MRSARLAETLEVLDLLLSGEHVDHEGDHVQLVGAVQRPKPLQDRIPILIGGGGPTLTMPLVARYADWWNCPAYEMARLVELQPLAGGARVSVQHPVGLAAGPDDRDEVVDWPDVASGTGAVCWRARPTRWRPRCRRRPRRASSASS